MTTTATTKATTTHLEHVRHHDHLEPRPTVFQRLADWLWPQVYGQVDYYYYYIETQSQTTSPPPTATTTHASVCRDAVKPCSSSSSSSPSSPQVQADIACRSCRVQGLDCDRQLPHCSQCRDQQALCFFVAPLPRLTKTAAAKSSAKTGKAGKAGKAVPSSRPVQC